MHTHCDLAAVSLVIYAGVTEQLWILMSTKHLLQMTCSNSPIECVCEPLWVCLFRLTCAVHVVIIITLYSLNWPFKSLVSLQNEGSAFPLCHYGYFLFILRQLSDLKTWNTSTWTCVVHLQHTGMSFSQIHTCADKSYAFIDCERVSALYVQCSQNLLVMFLLLDNYFYCLELNLHQ